MHFQAPIDATFDLLGQISLFVLYFTISICFVAAVLSVSTLSALQLKSSLYNLC